MPLKLMYITNNLSVALIIEKYGVERVWIDLEQIGKEERQYGRDSVKSHHTVSDIKIIKPHLTKAKILVRINHWYDGSPSEINDVVNAGADMIMLPYWKTIDEVQHFLDAVRGRCKTILLLETKEAVEIVDEVLKFPIDEIYIGLNDLHLSYNMDFMFELLSNGIVENLCQKFKNIGIPYGFGGIARLGKGDILAEHILVEHYRLGSSRVILSRSFCNIDKLSNLQEVDLLFKTEMRKLRSYEKVISYLSEEEYLKNRDTIYRLVDMLVKQK